MRMAEIRIAKPERLVLAAAVPSAFAMASLTVLGGGRESLDRRLKSSTSKTRTHSLFRQCRTLHQSIPTRP